MIFDANSGIHAIMYLMNAVPATNANPSTEGAPRAPENKGAARANTPANTIPGKNGLTLSELRKFVKRLIVEGQSEEALELLFDLLQQLIDDNNLKAIRLARLLKEQFGRRSEKLDPRQLAMFLQSASQDPHGEEEPENGEQTEEDKKIREEIARLKERLNKDKKPRKRGGRLTIPEGHETIVRRSDVPLVQRTCETCGQEKAIVGVETSKMIEYRPATFVVVVDERVKRACKECEEGMSRAPAPDKPIEKGLPGPGLLAHLVVSKFYDHIPLNHLSKVYSRSGFRIPSSTLGQWLAMLLVMLEPLYKALCAQAKNSELVGTDDTGLKVLDRQHPNHIKRGHIWCYIGYARGHPETVAFEYAPNWEGQYPRKFLEDYRGPLQSDGYAGLEPLFRGPDPACINVGCMTHMRRKFVAALEGEDMRAAAPVSLVQALYAVEELATLRGADVDERYRLRQEHSRPAMERLKKWLSQNLAYAEPKTPLGKAVTYLRNQWDTLQVYLTDGAIPIDNTEVERQIRAVARGRKAYLFAGSDEGGRRAAMMYTMVANCVIHGVEPQTWLTDVLDKLSSGWPMSRLEELLPASWKPPEKTFLERIAEEAASETSTDPS